MITTHIPGFLVIKHNSGEISFEKENEETIFQVLNLGQIPNEFKLIILKDSRNINVKVDDNLSQITLRGDRKEQLKAIADIFSKMIKFHPDERKLSGYCEQLKIIADEY